MDTQGVETDEAIAQQDAIIKRSRRYGNRGAILSIVLGFVTLSGGMAYMFSQMPEKPPTYTTYQDAVKTHTILEKELAAKNEGVPYKNPAVEAYLEARTPTETLEAALAAVHADIYKLKEDPALTARLDAEKMEDNYFIGLGALVPMIMLVGAGVSIRAERRVFRGRSPFGWR